MTSSRPELRLVQGATEARVPWKWFCGRCAAPAAGDIPPDPTARVCTSCGLGLLLESRADALPAPDNAFLVIDASLLIQGLSCRAEELLSLPEELAVNRPVSDLVVPADAEAASRSGFAAAIVQAIDGTSEPVTAYVRPWNTFGVRMRARVAACGPPRAALVVLDESPAPLRSVDRG